MCYRRKGFTLPELVIVIVLLSVLAVTAVPAVGRLFAFSLDTTANALASDLRFAQSLSISRTSGYSVDFSLANGYRVLDPAGQPVTDPARPGTDLVVDFSEPRYRGLTLSGAGFDGTPRVYFDSLGVPYQADGVTALAAQGRVALTADQDTRTVTVEPATGKVSIQ